MNKKSDAYEVVMPKLGLIMEEAMLVEWHKIDGDWIDQGELLFSLESDKSIIDIEAPASGYVQILVQAEQTVPVMTPVALIVKQPADLKKPGPESHPTPTTATGPSQQAPKRIVAPESSRSLGLRASPKARRIARQRGISLTGIQGNGPRGMIVAADLDQAVAHSNDYQITPVARKMADDFGLDLASVTGTGQQGKITREDISRTVRELTGASIPQESAAKNSSSHLPGLRAVIAKRLTDSWNQRPQVTLNSRIDATALVTDRERRKTAGQSVTYNAYFVKTCALALEAFPDLNVYLTPDAFIHLEQINIGLAVDTDRGLMVPVLKNAHLKSIQELDQEIQDLAERALSGGLLPEEYSGGSFTITNLGAFGVDSFSPIINPPESGILGVGRIQDWPDIKVGELVTRKTVILSLSFDHRVIDGAPAAKFLQKITQQLQDPTLLGTY